MRKMVHILAFATLASGTASVALAGTQQRDPAYQAARDQGLVGEQPDGYLGIVGTPTPALRALVNNINFQRKKAYTDGAGSGSTIEQFAFVSGCNLIAKTVPGEKYQTPDGRWLTRDASAPVRDPRCA
jgi:uncharacterized protein YdbL (DUF1318 family)